MPMWFLAVISTPPFLFLVYFMRSIMIYFSPTINFKVGKPTISLDRGASNIILPSHPVYLQISFKFKSWVKTDFWRNMLQPQKPKVGIVACDIDGSRRFHLVLEHNPQFASYDNPYVRGKIVFRRKIAEAEEKPVLIKVNSVILRIRRTGARLFERKYHIGETLNSEDFDIDWSMRNDD